MWLAARRTHFANVVSLQGVVKPKRSDFKTENQTQRANTLTSDDEGT